MICVFFIFCSVIVGGGVPVQEGQVSRFDIPYGNVYLAHNHLDGKYFNEIKVGQMIRYGDETGWHDFQVTDIIEAQASQPYSLTTALLIEGEWRSPEWVHQNIYAGKDRLVLQTCICRDGNAAWGRLFVIAERWQE